MAQHVAHIRRLPTREAAERRRVAQQLVAQQHAIPDDVVGQLTLRAQRARAEYLRELRRQALDQDEPIWADGGYDMFSRRQMEHIRRELRKLSGKDRRQDVYDAFLMFIGNIDRDTGQILLSRKDFADELGIALRSVSSVMTTLARLNVIRREYDSGRVSYFINAHVAWNGDLTLRKAEAAKSRKPSEVLEEPAEAAAPLLTLMQGGLAEQPGQAPGQAPGQVLAVPGVAVQPARKRKRKAAAPANAS
jgi:hypothetical protein